MPAEAAAAVPTRHLATEAAAGLQSGCRSSALAISALFTTLVLMPLPRPSICWLELIDERRGNDVSNVSSRH